MHASETVHAEPRDSVEAPAYRVNFWQLSPSRGSWSLDAYVLTDAKDVTEVLTWAEMTADGRRFEVFAEVDDEPVSAYEKPRTASLVRLFGSNPNAGESVEIGRFEPI